MASISGVDVEGSETITHVLEQARIRTTVVSPAIPNEFVVLDYDDLYGVDAQQPL